MRLIEDPCTKATFTSGKTTALGTVYFTQTTAANTPGDKVEFEYPTTEVNPSDYSCTITLTHSTVITRNTGAGATTLTAGYGADNYDLSYVSFSGTYTREADPGKTFNTVAVVKDYSFFKTNGEYDITTTVTISGDTRTGADLP